MGSKLKVGIIGAGAAGLAAARVVSSQLDLFDIPVVLERSSFVGGLWALSDAVSPDNKHLNNNYVLYHSLRTNLPKEVMAFPDFPFDSQNCEEKSFIRHDQVQDYLKTYARDFDLNKFIQFNTLVQSVRPTEKEYESTGWTVDALNTLSNRSSTLHFDVLFICNGHYSLPKYPEISGLNEFSGHCIHSAAYQEPSIYKDQEVVVLGASSSGLDISLEVATVAKKVYLSHNLASLTCTLPANLHQVVGIERVFSTGVRLLDGAEIHTNYIILCTGYRYNFPFLSADCGVKVSGHGDHVTPLYEHIINCCYPRMAFIGLPCRVVPFPLFYAQCIYYCAVLRGKAPFPANNQLTALDQSRDCDVTDADQSASSGRGHVLAHCQWSYMHRLSQLAKSSPVFTEAVRSLYIHVSERRKKDLLRYREDVYCLNDSNDGFHQLN